MLLSSSHWVTRHTSKNKARTSWAARIFQWLSNLPLKSSCRLTGPGSLFRFVFYLPSVPRLSAPCERGSVLAISSGFSCSLSAPRCCSRHSHQWIIAPVAPKSIIPFPKIIVWVGCDPVPRLWFPGHIMISPPRCCLPAAKSGWIKGIYFCFAHNAQKAASVSSKGNRLIYFNSLFPFQSIKEEKEENLAFLPVSKALIKGLF